MTQVLYVGAVIVPQTLRLVEALADIGVQTRFSAGKGAVTPGDVAQLLAKGAGGQKFACAVIGSKASSNECVGILRAISAKGIFTPVVVLLYPARNGSLSSSAVRLACFESGAAGCIDFLDDGSAAESLALIRNTIQRELPFIDKRRVLDFGGEFVFDMLQKQLWTTSGKPVKVSGHEKVLIELLLTDAPVTREKFYERVGGIKNPEDQRLDTKFCRLREKLTKSSETGADWKAKLLCVDGGYRLVTL